MKIEFTTEEAEQVAKLIQSELEWDIEGSEPALASALCKVKDGIRNAK